LHGRRGELVRSMTPRSNIRRCRTGIPEFGRTGRHYNFSPSVAIAAPQFEDSWTRSSRLGHHLEISELHPARRQFAREFYYDRGFRTVTSRSISGTKMFIWARTPLQDHLQGHRRGVSQNTIRPRYRAPPRRRRSIFTACDSLRSAQMRRTYRAYIEAKNSSGAVRARSGPLKISEDVLFYCVTRAVAGGSGRLVVMVLSRTCCSNCRWNSRRSAEADLDFAGRFGWIGLLRRGKNGRT